MLTIKQIYVKNEKKLQATARRENEKPLARDN